MATTTALHSQGFTMTFDIGLALTGLGVMSVLLILASALADYIHARTFGGDQ